VARLLKRSCTNNGSQPPSMRWVTYERRSEWKSSPSSRPSASRYSQNRLCSVPDPIRGPRSDGHSAADATADGISGRASSIHWASTCGTHSHTVSTLRCLGGDPFIALPNRTWHTP